MRILESKLTLMREVSLVFVMLVGWIQLMYCQCVPAGTPGTVVTSCGSEIQIFSNNTLFLENTDNGVPSGFTDPCGLSGSHSLWYKYAIPSGICGVTIDFVPCDFFSNPFSLKNYSVAVFDGGCAS